MKCDEILNIILYTELVRLALRAASMDLYLLPLGHGFETWDLW